MNSGEYSIDKMGQSDLDEVLSIENSVSPVPWSRNLFIEEMRNNLSHCYVIKNGKKQGSPVMGFICFRNITEESELLNIGVRPDVQRTGIGKVLMQFHIDFSSQAGVKSFYLEVNSTNQPALRLYRMFSYRSTGVRERFYQGKYDALLMERTI